MTEAKKLLARASKSAVQLFGMQGQVLPMFDIESEDGKHHLVPVMFDTARDKDEIAFFVRNLLIEKKAVRYAWLTEAWSVASQSGADMERVLDHTASGGSLEHHPDRDELLMVTVEDRDTHECWMRQYRILRPEHGPPTLSPPRDYDLSKDSTGRFMRMFAHR